MIILELRSSFHPLSRSLLRTSSTMVRTHLGLDQFGCMSLTCHQMFALIVKCSVERGSPLCVQRVHSGSRTYIFGSDVDPATQGQTTESYPRLLHSIILPSLRRKELPEDWLPSIRCDRHITRRRHHRTIPINSRKIAYRLRHFNVSRISAAGPVFSI